MSVVENSELVDLARGAASGDPRALAALLDELAPLVVRTARLIVGPGSATAEDAAQEALADLARQITTLRAPDAVVAWAARIAVRRALRMAAGSAYGFGARSPSARSRRVASLRGSAVAH
jgi:DNA-directed RNA polymerase specialized sigma24 family protein